MNIKLATICGLIQILFVEIQLSTAYSTIEIYKDLSDAAFTSNSNWSTISSSETILNTFTTCGDKSVILTNSGGELNCSVELIPMHSQLITKFEVYILSSSSALNLSGFLNITIQQNNSDISYIQSNALDQSRTLTSTCTSSMYYLKFTQSWALSDSDIQDAIITIVVDTKDAGLQWGIRDFSLSYLQSCYESCFSCLNPDSVNSDIDKTCTSCLTPKYVFYESTGPLTQTCVENCLDSENKELLSNGSCVCKTEYYMNLTESTCDYCDFSCKTCYGSLQNNCLSCDQAGKNYTFNSSEGTCTCASGLFEDVATYSCQSCPSQCANCTYYDTCISCTSGYYLNSEDSFCYECSSLCKECDQNTGYCTSCFSENNRILQDGSCICPLDYTETNDACVKPDLSGVDGPVAVVQSMAVASAVTAAPTILLLSPTLIIQLLDVLQLVSYIQYIQVNYPPIVHKFLNQFDVFNFNFIPKIIGDNKYKMDSPDGFKSQGVDALLIRNIQQYIVICLALILVYIGTKISAHLILKSKKTLINKFINYIIKVFEWGLFIGQFQVSFLNFSVFSLMQLMNYSVVYGIQTLSICLAYVILNLLIIFLTLLCYVAIRINKGDIKNKDQFEDKFGVVYTFFKQEKFIQCGYFFVIAVRQFTFAFILVVLNNFPALSLFLFILTNLTIIFSQLRISPYKSTVYQFRDIATEISFALIHFMSFFLISNCKIKTDQRSQLGWAIVLFALFIMLANFAVLFKEQYEMIKETYHKCKARQSSRRVQDADKNDSKPQAVPIDGALQRQNSTNSLNQNQDNMSVYNVKVNDQVIGQNNDPLLSQVKATNKQTTQQIIYESQAVSKDVIGAEQVESGMNFLQLPSSTTTKQQFSKFSLSIQSQQLKLQVNSPALQDSSNQEQEINGQDSGKTPSKSQISESNCDLTNNSQRQQSGEIQVNLNDGIEIKPDEKSPKNNAIIINDNNVNEDLHEFNISHNSSLIQILDQNSSVIQFLQGKDDGQGDVIQGNQGKKKKKIRRKKVRKEVNDKQPK